MCEAHWDDSDYLDSCANQTGCTDCDESGFDWCHPTDMECKTVERDSEGNSKSWFRCEVETTDLLEGIAFIRICDNLCSIINNSIMEFFLDTRIVIRNILCFRGKSLHV